MTYNQFMAAFKEYKLYRIREAISTKYKNYEDAARDLGTSKSTISRVMNGAPIKDELLFKIVGYGFYNEEIVSPEEFEFRRIERMYKELLAERRKNLNQNLKQKRVPYKGVLRNILTDSEKEEIKAKEEKEKLNQAIAECILIGDGGQMNDRDNKR